MLFRICMKMTPWSWCFQKTWRDTGTSLVSVRDTRGAAAGARFTQSRTSCVECVVLVLVIGLKPYGSVQMKRSSDLWLGHHFYLTVPCK